MDEKTLIVEMFKLILTTYTNDIEAYLLQTRKHSCLKTQSRLVKPINVVYSHIETVKWVEVWTQMVVSEWVEYEWIGLIQQTKDITAILIVESNTRCSDVQ